MGFVVISKLFKESVQMNNVQISHKFYFVIGPTHRYTLKTKVKVPLGEDDLIQKVQEITGSIENQQNTLKGRNHQKANIDNIRNMLTVILTLVIKNLVKRKVPKANTKNIKVKDHPIQMTVPVVVKVRHLIIQ